MENLGWVVCCTPGDSIPREPPTLATSITDANADYKYNKNVSPS